jgi:hypothetical protein
MGIAYNPKVVTNGLVFNFDARNIKSYPGTGTACYDLAGQTTVGETVNSPTFNANGYFSFATDDYIRFPNSTALDVQTFTIEVWVRTNATSQNGFWFEKGTVNSQYSLFQEGGGIVCRINNTTGSVNTINPATATYMNTTNWYQVVFTFTSGSQICYINAVQVGTGTTVATLATNTGGMSIGAYGGYTGSRGYFYNGDQSIAKVYNRVLTPNEVQQNFNATRSRYGI